MDTIIEIQSERTVPVGYKHTELGMTPEDWDVSPLAKHTLFVGSGKTNTKSKGAFPLFGSTGQIGSCLNPEYEGDAILIARVGANAGKLSFVSGQYGVSDNTIIVKLKPQNNIHFFKYWLIFQNLNSLVFGSGQPLITGTQLKELLLPTPSINEQTAIANVLFDTDALISKIEQLIEKKQAIKTATMQQLLSGRTRLTQFSKYPNGPLKNHKSSELGLIPEDWEVTRLAEVARVIDPHPSHRAPPEVSYGVPFVGIGDLNESGEIINSEVRRVNQSILQEHSERYSLNNKPIGLGRVASIGKVIRLRAGKEPYAISPTLGVIDGFACRNDFLFYYLKSESVTEQFSRVMSGSTRSSVGMNVLKEILVVKISNEEQISIATILSDMDAELTALEQKLAKFRDIKQGMMQQLLTGRIRLPLDQQP